MCKRAYSLKALRMREAIAHQIYRVSRKLARKLARQQAARQAARRGAALMPEDA